MGQIDLPQCPLVSSNRQIMETEGTPSDLTDCRSPSPHRELAPSFFPKISNGQQCPQSTESESSPSISLATVSDVDQSSLQPLDLQPVPAFISDPAALQHSYLTCAPIGFANEPMPCVYIVPMVMPQQHLGLQPLAIHELGFPTNQDEAQTSGDTAPASIERGYEDNTAVPRLSASAARRRRRQRVATMRAQQGNDFDTHKSTCLKTPAGKESGRPKKSNVELRARLEVGGEGLLAALSEVEESIRHLTFDAEGCRIVQLALEKADQQDGARLCAELHGYVRRAIASPHGNYVIQRIVELMPVSVSSFVSSELVGFGAEAARHKYGCRILCRLLEHSSTQPLTIQLIDEILLEASELCGHNFAHHVMESILEHGTADQKHWIAQTLQANAFGYANDAYATYVIESALRNCSSADRQAIGAAFLDNEDGMFLLAEHHSGFHVVRALLRYAEQSSSFAALLQQEKCRLQASCYGNRCLALSYQGS